MDGNETALHLIPAQGVDRDDAFAEAKNALGRFLASQGVTDFTCALAAGAPAASEKNGKFKHIINKQMREKEN